MFLIVQTGFREGCIGVVMLVQISFREGVV